MNESLLDVVDRYARMHPIHSGLVRTPIRGLTLFRSTAPSGLVHAISQPLVCLVLQGAKQVAMGHELFVLGPGDSLLITADVPTVSQITVASSESPYLSVVLDLDPSAITELTMRMSSLPTDDNAPVRVEPTDSEVIDAVQRLMRLLDRPESVPVLLSHRLFELHYWLLAGPHGATIRRLGWPQGCSQRVARAVAVLRAEFTKTLPVDRLATIAGMSVSSFHHHFRAVTSLSPLQFQKQLRLIEARRLMMAEGVSSSSAAFAVGYESVSHFTREYARMFGLPPIKDAEAVKSWPVAVG